MKMISNFSEKYEFLSNFYPCRNAIEYKGKRFPTVEHAYQAAKCKNESDINLFLQCKAPCKAKSLGRKIELRDDWEQVKINIMTNLIRQKFQDRELAAMLLETGNAYLEEGNNWNDTFWGVCCGIGQNHLGKILMKIREELRHMYK